MTMRLGNLSLLLSACALAAGCSSGQGTSIGQPSTGVGGNYAATGGATALDGTASVGGSTEFGGGSGLGGSNVTSGQVDCSSVSGSGLPLNATRWVDASCGTSGIQGRWYCFDDGIQASSCVNNTPPFAANGMCQSGTSVDETGTYTSWGAGIGLSLSESGGNPSVKSAYNATANGVIGFRLTLEGNSLGQSMRVGFAGALNPGGLTSPHVEVGALVSGTPLTAEVMIADALVPLSWGAENSGAVADPTTLFDLQVQYPGGEIAGEYNYCITNVEAITEGSVATVTCDVSGLTSYGSTGVPLGEISAGSFMVQNDLWNPVNGASQTTTAYQRPEANSVAFVAQPSINVSTPEPASYPSAVYGWHYGTFYGSYSSPRQISAITSAPSAYEYCVPSAGRYNVSYDLWIHPQTNPATPSGGTELMIWTAYRDAVPIGTNVETVTLAGASWEVWYGQNGGGWDTLSYRRITNAPSVDFDVMDFVRDGVSRGYYQASEYLLSIQTGFEIWEGNQSFTAQRITTRIN